MSNGNGVTATISNAAEAVAEKASDVGSAVKKRAGAAGADFRTCRSTPP